MSIRYARPATVCLWVAALLWFGMALAASAQNIYPVINSAFYPENQNEYLGVGAITQDTLGQMYIGFSGGVVEFDGRNRLLMTTDAPVLALETHMPTNRVYIGCTNSFGYLARRADGKLAYTKLSVTTKDFSGMEEGFCKVLQDGQQIYFYYPHHLYIYDINSLQTRVVKLGAAEKPSLGVCKIQNKIYINLHDKGFCVLDGSTLKPVGDDHSLDLRRLMFYTPFSDKEALIGTSSGQMFISDGAGEAFARAP